MEDLKEQFKEIRPLQEKHCELLTYIDQFCKENDIVWSLAFGSVLGAMRHGGPIPWDDDADIYMTAQDYEKFRKCFREKGDKEHFYLQELDGIDGMISVAKLRMNGTTYIEENQKDRDMHHGIFVDIFLLHECPPTKWGRIQGIAAICYLTLKRLSIRNYKKRKIVRPLIVFLRMFPKKFGMKTAYKQFYKWDDHPGDMLADWEQYNGSPRWFVPKDVIFPVKRMEYDGHQFCVPNQTERYLEICYGDWKQLPSMEHIQWTQHAWKTSTTEDFRKFAENVHDFSDETLD